MAAITSAPHFIRTLSTRTTCGEGSTVTLEATVSGRPRPVVTWHKSGSPVLLRAGHDRHAAYDSELGRCRLVIGSANVDDEGEYECRAKNILGQVSCFGELYVIRHTASRSAGHSARMTTRMGSPLTDDSTNDEPEIKSGLFILIDEGSQDEENSDELGHRGSISASEQIESIIEDLTLADGSLNLSLAKDGTFVSEDGSIRGEDADDSKDLKMFKSKKLGDYFVDDDDDDVVEDSGNVFEDPDYDDGFDPMRYARPNGGGGRTYARHRSHVETGPWNREKRRDKPPATAASLHLHKVNAEERLNEVFDYSADGSECPLDDDSLEVSNRRATSDMFQGEEDRPPFFDDINVSPSSRRGKIKSESYDMNFEGLDTWKASTNVPVVLPPPLGSRRFTTTDEADQDLEVLPLLHDKVVRQRSNSDGKLPVKAVDDGSRNVPVDTLKKLDCPWDSTDKIWNDSIGTSDQSDRALANSDVDGSNDEVFAKDQIGVLRRKDLQMVTADNNVAEFQPISDENKSCVSLPLDDARKSICKVQGRLETRFNEVQRDYTHAIISGAVYFLYTALGDQDIIMRESGPLPSKFEDIEERLAYLESRFAKKYPEVKFLTYKDRKRILVTGGAGFVGSHLVDRLMLEGHEIMVADNFFTGRKRNIEHWIGHENFELIHHDIVNPLYIEVDEVYHLASPASPPHYMYNPVKTIKTNTLGTINVLGLAKRVGARVLIASTSEVYGDPEVHPQPETYWGHVNPIGPRACYDEGKRVSETLSYAYAKQENIEVRVARIFNTFGPRMHMNDGRVVSNFILQALQNEPITIYGSGEQTRSFQYVNDLVDGLIALMNSNYSLPVNIGNPEEHTINEFATIIKGVVGGHSDIVRKVGVEDDPQRRKPDIGRAKMYLKWKPKVSLLDGINKTVEYFRRELQRSKHSPDNTNNIELAD